MGEGFEKEGHRKENHPTEFLGKTEKEQMIQQLQCSVVPGKEIIENILKSLKWFTAVCSC